MLRVESIRKSFPRRGEPLEAVSDVSFSLNQGETFSLVGESGSGKSTLAMMLTGHIVPDQGRIVLDGEDTQTMKRTERKKFRQKIQLIFQDPFTSFNPLHPLHKSLAEPLTIQKKKRAETDRAALEKRLRTVDLGPGILDRYPGQVSGGELQRLAIARALVLEPAYLVLDEATAMLDASTQASILHMLKTLQTRMNLGIVFISHDLDVAAFMGDSIAVMHRGRFVEQGRTAQVIHSPVHAYTRELIRYFKEFDHA